MITDMIYYIPTLNTRSDTETKICDLLQMYRGSSNALRSMTHWPVNVFT